MAVRILSVGTALPGPPVDTAALARCLGMNDVWRQWVDTFIGTRTRHLSVNLETGEQTQTLADLGTVAEENAMRDAGIAADDIDVVVLGTATPDELMPATVAVIADRLRINDVPTFQLQSGCSGAVQTFDVATALLATGRYRTTLVLGGDVIARHYDVSADLTAVRPRSSSSLPSLWARPVRVAKTPNRAPRTTCVHTDVCHAELADFPGFATFAIGRKRDVNRLFW